MFQGHRGDWPQECEEKYERFEVLGKGSFGMVWMSRRMTPPDNEYDDEFAAIKNIQIKNEKSRVYAEREINILKELKHPHVIRLINAYPEYQGTRVVVMQLARGPNLHQLVVKRGALGLPLCRMVARQLIGAVSYIHGRAVIHRDIKPSNCILACQDIPVIEDYDWFEDEAIWNSDQLGEDAVARNRWKLMLVDFGFARALEQSEIETPSTRHLRNSIVFEHDKLKNPKRAANGGTPNALRTSIKEAENEDEDASENSADSIAEDLAVLEEMASNAAEIMRKSAYVATNQTEAAIMGVPGERDRERMSAISMNVEEGIPKKKKSIFARKQAKPNVPAPNDTQRRVSRTKVRSMSALGTKAYAAPEIRKKLRQKTDEDVEKANAAMTECVADYGMIVDAYSVGWTLRVAMTGVPPNFTISEYMQERENVVMEGEEEDPPVACFCCGADDYVNIRIREPKLLPKSATMLITKLTEKEPEDRLTVREAQNHVYIKGDIGENPYTPPQGDFPSLHGDPVVPLTCSEELSKLTVQYHMQ